MIKPTHSSKSVEDKEKAINYAGSSESPGQYYETSTQVDELKGWSKFKDGFKRKPDEGPAGKQLQKGISRRHLLLMALVTGVGTGLLVGAGGALRKSGPLFLIVGYAMVGSMLYPTLQSAGEMAVNYSDLSGGYNNYPRKFVDGALAFAISWNYCIQWLSVIAIELVTAAMTIQYWNTSINPDVWVAIIYVFILFVNFYGAKGYGEGEFILGSCKLLMLIGFIIMSLVINLGGGPEKEFIGGRYWREVGYYTSFKGLASVLVTGAFSMGMSEFVALSAAEQTHPAKAIPLSCKLVLWKIIVLFLGSLTMVGLLVPYTSPRLMGSGSGDTSASPFVLAAALHGVKAVPSIINAVILISVTSVGSSALYSSSRTLQSLAEQNYAPSWFNFIDKEGRPLRALIVCSIVGLFSFIAAFDQHQVVFDWLLAISGLSQIFTWFAICISHVRFRAALKYNNISVNSLGYVSQTGLWGSYYAITWHILILIAQFWIALFPYGGASPTASNFFQNYLGAVVFLAFYFGYKIYHKDWKLYLKVEDIDIHSDRTIFDEEVLNLERQEEKDKFKALSFPMKVLKTLFF